MQMGNLRMPRLAGGASGTIPRRDWGSSTTERCGLFPENPAWSEYALLTAGLDIFAGLGLLGAGGPTIPLYTTLHIQRQLAPVNDVMVYVVRTFRTSSHWN
jgi:hypothetical protein